MIFPKPKTDIRWDYCTIAGCADDNDVTDADAKDDDNWCTHEGVDLKWQLYSAGERKEKGYVGVD